ncbi:MAG TPA: hypothetical protein VMJ30_03720, partial [Gemmatimonadales bacterium]|nr:hypothetical protein [Gemmatimonadales bacterium]
RFTQIDPIGVAGGANVYGFAAGDPVDYTDPFGLAADTLEGVQVEQMASEKQNQQQAKRTLCIDQFEVAQVQAINEEAVAAGIPVTFNNAYRDRVTGASPGHTSAGDRSDHPAGFAFDINSGSLTVAQNQQFTGIAARYGFTPVRNDAGHYEANYALHLAYGSHSAAVAEATRSYAAHECVDANVEAVRQQQ